MKELNDNEFAGFISKDVTLVDFWAPWCRPCQMQIPILEQIDKDFNGRAKVAKVNVDDYPELAGQFDVRGIPTMLVFENGIVVDRYTGVQTYGTLACGLNALIKGLTNTCKKR